MTNRVCIELDENGHICNIVADEEVEIFIVDPKVPHDRVYQYESTEFGSQYVRKMIGGYAVGHLHDGTLGISDGTGKRKPSVPTLTIVGNDNED